MQSIDTTKKKKLLKALDTAQYEERLSILLKLAKLYQQEPTKAHTYLDEAIIIAKKINDGVQYADVLEQKGNLHWQNAQYTEAQKYVEAVLEMRIKAGEERAIGEACINMGNIVFIHGDYTRAFRYYLKALKIKESFNDLNKMATCYNNIALVLSKQENYDSALEYYLKAAQIHENVQNHAVRAKIYNSIGSIYKIKKDYSKALHYFDQVYLLRKDSADVATMARYYYETGEIYDTQGKHDKGLQHFHKALQLLQKSPNQTQLAICLLKIGSTLQVQKKYVEAIEHLEKALAIINELCFYSCLEKAYDCLSQSYAGIGDHKKAYDYMRLYMEHKQETFSKDKTHALTEMKTRYETEKKEIEIAQLNKEQEMLQKINEELNHFAGKAAHDLKEPLRMVSGFIGLLQKKYGKLFDDDAAAFFSIIENSTVRMDTLLGDLLKFAKTGDYAQNKTLIDLNEIIEIVTTNLKPRIDAKNALIDCTALPQVFANQTAMTQLFQNLVGNGIKFCEAGIPKIKITVEDQQDEYLFAIQDNGIGIKEEYHQRIFGTFKRLHAKHEYEGSGLGLAICKKIVHALNGKIWLTSIIGQGTTFYFTIPKQKPMANSMS